MTDRPTTSQPASVSNELDIAVRWDEGRNLEWLNLASLQPIGFIDRGNHLTDTNLESTPISLELYHNVMMPPHPSSSDSENDNDIPEAVSLSQSKKRAKQDSAKLQAAHAAVKSRTKEKNRERDRKLKERAEETRSEVKVVREEREDGRNRKRRKIVEEEDGSEEEAWSGVGGESSEKDDESESDGDDSPDSDDEDGAGERLKPRTNDPPRHLPDHLFKSAFSSQNSTKPSLSSEKSTLPSKKPKRTRSSKPKDLIVGSRVIRTLPKASLVPSTVAKTLPSTKVRKFVDRTLGLKGNSRKTKSWQRVPANIGVMKRNGPAANFVRNPVSS